MSDVNQTNAKLWRAERQEVASPFLSDAHRTEQSMLTHSFGGFLIFQMHCIQFTECVGFIFAKKYGSTLYKKSLLFSKKDQTLLNLQQFQEILDEITYNKLNTEQTYSNIIVELVVIINAHH